MKILLINPPISQEDVYSKYAAGAPCLPPLGLCYLAAVLIDKGYRPEIIDCAAEKMSHLELLKKVAEYKPDIVGVSCTTVSYDSARQVLAAVKKIDQTITTVLGGAHLSALPKSTMEECDFIDIGVYGEGEFTFLEIVERLEAQQSLDNIYGAVVRFDEDVVENRPRQPIARLDEIPFPARNLLKDLRLYSHTPFRGARFTATMITGRGCPFQCGFCDQSVFGKKWRYHSPDYVVSEMLHLKKNYDVDFVSIEDDNFMLSKKRTMDICRKMIDSSLNMNWSCLGHANEVDDEVLSLMKEAGCRTIYLGIESGSPRILELIHKNVSIEEMNKAVKLIKKHKMSVVGSFILGLPTETQREVDMTVDLALTMPLDGVSFFIFTPYPNTPLRELALQHGKVSENWRDYSGHPHTLPFVPNGITEEYLLGMQSSAYRKFLLRPMYLIKHFSDFSSWKAIKNGFGFLKALNIKR
jgi:radical SAM superfamily enzyme YgiQ (UPF0313 family)